MAGSLFCNMTFFASLQEGFTCVDFCGAEVAAFVFAFCAKAETSGAVIAIASAKALNTLLDVKVIKNPFSLNRLQDMQDLFLSRTRFSLLL